MVAVLPSARQRVALWNELLLTNDLSLDPGQRNPPPNIMISSLQRGKPPLDESQKRMDLKLRVGFPVWSV